MKRFWRDIGILAALALVSAPVMAHEPADRLWRLVTVRLEVQRHWRVGEEKQCPLDKLWIRTALALWWAVILLGLATYYVWL